jgi:hypothetical protein
MAQADNFRHHAKEGRVQSQASPCRTFGRQSGTKTRIPPSTSIFLVNNNRPFLHKHSFIHPKHMLWILTLLETFKDIFQNSYTLRAAKKEAYMKLKCFDRKRWTSNLQYIYTPHTLKWYNSKQIFRVRYTNSKAFPLQDFISRLYFSSLRAHNFYNW